MCFEQLKVNKFMKAKYTKKQIREAINYWQKQLNQMICEENILRQLSYKYGNTLVMSKHSNFVITNELAYELFDIMNESIFNKKLDKCEIFCGTYDEIINKQKSRNSLTPSNSFYAMFDTIIDDKHIKTINDKILYLSNIIILNTTKLTKSNFLFVCSSLCHEMIHYYDQMYGEKPICDKHHILYNVNIDMHTTPTFITMKRKANDMGLTIINRDDELSFSDLNTEAYINMINSIVNDGSNINESELDKKSNFTYKDNSNKLHLCHID